MGGSMPGSSVLYSLQSLLTFTSIELVMISNHFILSHSLLLLLAIFPSISVFFRSALWIRWPKYWCFSFSISPSNEYSGLISFRIDWFDLLAVQGTVKSLLQHHNSEASILWYSAFFTVQLSYPNKTTGKTKTLTIWIFICKVMSLLFNTLSMFVIAFLLRRKHPRWPPIILVSWHLCSYVVPSHNEEDWST